MRCRKLSLVAPPPSAGGLSYAGLSDGLPPSPSSCSPAYRRPDWLLFNDFCIAPCASAEVLALFGNQKVPCLLYYSRVSNPPYPNPPYPPPAYPHPPPFNPPFLRPSSSPPSLPSLPSLPNTSPHTHASPAFIQPHGAMWQRLVTLVSWCNAES